MSTSIERLLDRNADKIYYHPRTGEKMSTCTCGDKVHSMPPISNLHTNGCPRTTYHRMVNAQWIGDTPIPTGQLKTFWGERKHGYVSKHQHAQHGAGRFLPPQMPERKVRILCRHIDRAIKETKTTVQVA